MELFDDELSEAFWNEWERLIAFELETAKYAKSQTKATIMQRLSDLSPTDLALLEARYFYQSSRVDYIKENLKTVQEAHALMKKIRAKEKA